MRVCVIGAGIVGVMTAYYLWQKGFSVDLFEKESEVAKQASFANASTLHFSYITPIGSPQTFKIAPKILSDQLDTIKIIKKYDPSFWMWSLKFLNQCRKENFDKNRDALIRMAQESRSLFDEFVNDHTINFDYQSKGKLVVYDNAAAFSLAKEYCNILNSFDLDTQSMDTKELNAFDPKLEQAQRAYSGGIYYKSDAQGDSSALANALVDKMGKSSRFSLRLSEPILGFDYHNDYIDGLVTKKGEYRADKYVLCTGAYMTNLLSKLKVKTNIYPIKGYTMTLDRDTLKYAPRNNVTDNGLATVVVPMEDKLKISAFAHFAGHNADFPQPVLEKIKNNAKLIMPDIQIENVNLATGFRPYTPNGLPIVEQTHYKNLYMNMGHSMYGWTLSAITSKKLADMIGME